MDVCPPLFALERECERLASTAAAAAAATVSSGFNSACMEERDREE